MGAESTDLRRMFNAQFSMLKCTKTLFHSLEHWTLSILLVTNLQSIMPPRLPTAAP
jgi:hypothetical protein